MMLRTFLAFLIALSLGLPAASSDFSEMPFTCPVDGKTFEAWVPVSGTITGYSLDFNKNGYYPSRREMPTCPDSGFVMYQHDYTPSEIVTIKRLVKTSEFTKVRDGGNRWLTAAFEMRQLGAKPGAIASMYLSATWAEEKDPGKYRPIAEEAHAYMSTIPDKEKGIYYLVLGELERRLGRFEAARRRFKKLPPGYAQTLKAEGWKPSDLKRYIKRQLHFIAANNTLSQPVNPKQELP